MSTASKVTAQTDIQTYTQTLRNLPTRIREVKMLKIILYWTEVKLHLLPPKVLHGTWHSTNQGSNSF